jgi:hypothetical protein
MVWCAGLIAMRANWKQENRLFKSVAAHNTANNSEEPASFVD